MMIYFKLNSQSSSVPVIRAFQVGTTCCIMSGNFVFSHLFGAILCVNAVWTKASFIQGDLLMILWVPVAPTGSSSRTRVACYSGASPACASARTCAPVINVQSVKCGERLATTCQPALGRETFCSFSLCTCSRSWIFTRTEDANYNIALTQQSCCSSPPARRAVPSKLIASPAWNREVSSSC